MFTVSTTIHAVPYGSLSDKPIQAIPLQQKKQTATVVAQDVVALAPRPDTPIRAGLVLEVSAGQLSTFIRAFNEQNRTNFNEIPDCFHHVINKRFLDEIEGDLDDSLSRVVKENPFKVEVLTKKGKQDKFLLKIGFKGDTETHIPPVHDVIESSAKGGCFL